MIKLSSFAFPGSLLAETGYQVNIHPCQLHGEKKWSGSFTALIAKAPWFCTVCSWGREREKEGGITVSVHPSDRGRGGEEQIERKGRGATYGERERGGPRAIVHVCPRTKGWSGSVRKSTAGFCPLNQASCGTKHNRNPLSVLTPFYPH